MLFTHQPDSEPEGLRRVLCKALLRLQVVLLFFVCLWQAALVEMLTNSPSPFVSLGPSVGHSWQQGASRVLKFGGKAIGSISFSTAARLVYLRRRVGDSTPVEEIQFTLSGSPKCRPLRIQVGAPAVEVLSPADAMTSFVDQVVLDPGAAGQLVRQVAWLTGLHVAVAVDGGGGDSVDDHGDGAMVRRRRRCGDASDDEDGGGNGDGATAAMMVAMMMMAAAMVMVRLYDGGGCRGGASDVAFDMVLDIFQLVFVIVSMICHFVYCFCILFYGFVILYIVFDIFYVGFDIFIWFLYLFICFLYLFIWFLIFRK